MLQFYGGQVSLCKVTRIEIKTQEIDSFLKVCNFEGTHF